MPQKRDVLSQLCYAVPNTKTYLALLESHYSFSSQWKQRSAVVSLATWYHDQTQPVTQVMAVIRRAPSTGQILTAQSDLLLSDAVCSSKSNYQSQSKSLRFLCISFTSFTNDPLPPTHTHKLRTNN